MTESHYHDSTVFMLFAIYYLMPNDEISEANQVAYQIAK